MFRGSGTSLLEREMASLPNLRRLVGGTVVPIGLELAPRLVSLKNNKGSEMNHGHCLYNPRLSLLTCVLRRMILVW